MCASDALALGAIRAVRGRACSVPDDVSVVGFDDSIYMIATDPPLTTLRQPIQAMATAAVESLNAQINGNTVPSDESDVRAGADRARLDPDAPRYDRSCASRTAASFLSVPA